MKESLQDFVLIPEVARFKFVACNQLCEEQLEELQMMLRHVLFVKMGMLDGTAYWRLPENMPLQNSSDG